MRRKRNGGKVADFGLCKTTQLSARVHHWVAESTKGDSKFLGPWRGSPPLLSLHFAPDQMFFEACKHNVLCLEYLGISKMTSTGMTGMPRITRMTSVRGLRAQRCGDSVTVIMDYIHAS